MAAKASTDTRTRIIENAKTLLRRHGPDKLTVVDIGRSLGMSHANVYRFFKSKTEILDAIIEEWMLKLEAFVEEIAARRGSAAVRIEAVVLELHRKRKQKLLEDPEVFETYRRLMEIRPDFAPRRREKILRVFQRLVEAGVRTGEFEKIKSAGAAIVLKDATSLFLHPLMIPTTMDQDTEARAREVVRYVLAGIQAGKISRPRRR